MTKTELKEFLDAKVIQYNNPKFIESDPIQIPHQFILKEDIEIAAFLTATIAWGNRKMIIKNAKGVAIVLVPQVLHVPLSGSEAFAEFCRVLSDLMYYR